jgi:ABC-2 type transport system ATP-binding protein
MLGATAVTAVDGMLRVAADPERAADINAMLIGEHIRVSELRPAERSLEDVFLKVTAAEGEAA